MWGWFSLGVYLSEPVVKKVGGKVCSPDFVMRALELNKIICGDPVYSPVKHSRLVWWQVPQLCFDGSLQVLE